MANKAQLTEELAPIFLMGCPRSGTSLTLALLDGHPELLVYPMELKYFCRTDHPTLFPELKLAACSEAEGVRQSMLADVLFTAWLKRDREELKRQFNACDPDKFIQSFKGNGEAARSHAELFTSCFEALLVSMGRPGGELSRYRAVEKTPLQEEHAPLLKQWFPRARFIHIVRNPYAVLLSLRTVLARMAHGDRFRTLKGANRLFSKAYPSLKYPVSWMAHSEYFRKRNHLLLGEAYLTVRYEDLVLEPQRMLRTIASHLGIQFNESMLSPSIAGADWHGNATGKRLVGVDASRSARWKDSMSAFELALINRHLSEMMAEHRYEQVSPKAGVFAFVPQRWELPGTYWSNRSLLSRSAAWAGGSSRLM